MKSKMWFYVLCGAALFSMSSVVSAKTDSYSEKLEVQHMRDLEPEEKSIFENYDAYVEDGRIFKLINFSSDIAEVNVHMYDALGRPVQEEVMNFESGIGRLVLPPGCKGGIICWEDGNDMYVSYLP